MLCAGFTIVKNAVRYGYPVKESILSALPLCDVFYVLIGDCDDGTEALIRSINSDKIIIHHSVWDHTVNTNGEVLALETNKAMAMIPDTYSWLLYLQADEALHENDYACIREAMQLHTNNHRVDGLLFSYHHFWGSFSYVGTTSKWYRREIRIVKNRKDIFSYRDAQGFRKKPNQKLQVVLLDAHVYHYGWVRPPAKMQEKYAGVQQYWSNENKYIPQQSEFDYSQIDDLAEFTGTHPALMQTMVNNQLWEFSYDASRTKMRFKEKIKRVLFQLTGYRFFEYKNYRIISS
ncbi:MAG: glycosyltransferase family 2 protein [Chitinophagaceae bacterium]|nr:glycosyltransferase family 2 protein [Chitinophagaceae bacterium]